MNNFFNNLQGTQSTYNFLYNETDAEYVSPQDEREVIAELSEGVNFGDQYEL